MTAYRRPHCAIRSLLYPLLLLATAFVAHAEERYPAHPIELLVPFGASGGADHLARMTAVLLEKEVHSPFKVVNMPGETGGIAIKQLLKGEPDGYSLAVLTADTFALQASSWPDWKSADLVPLAVMIKQQSGFFVSENSRFKDWAAFEKEARAKPNSLKVAITGLGSPDDMTLNYLSSKGIVLVPVFFAEPAERYAALLKGEADALYEQAGDVKGYLESKQMRPIIFFSEKRAAAFKDVPAAKELGYTLSLPQFRALVVRSGTSPAKVRMLEEALARIAATPEYRAYLKAQYAEDDSFVGAKNVGAFLRDKFGAMEKIVAATYFPRRFVNQAKDIEPYVEPF